MKLSTILKNTLLCILGSLIYMSNFSYAANAPVIPAAPAIPGMPTEAIEGISILPLDKQPVPNELKDLARMDISQMKRNGFIDAPESVVAILDTINVARKSKDPLLKLPAEITRSLVFSPSTLGSLLSEATLLDAEGSGGLTEKGWTGLYRLFAVQNIGLVKLEEVDYIVSKGGWGIIKEAINQDVNGHPAILNVKQSQSGKGLSELVWATDRKIFTLTLNKAVKDKVTIDAFLKLANGISG